jgi:Ca2+-binding RTX toxin-like protein
VLADRNGGQDTVNFAPVTSNLSIWLDGTDGQVGDTPWRLASNARIEHAIGGDGADRIHGNVENNWLRGMRGDDALHGEAGNDRLEGGAGNDQLFGGLGQNRIFGGDDDDILQTGNDGSLMSGGRGDDEVHGGDGDDTLYGFAGADRLEGGLGADILDGGKGDDIVLGGDGDDRIVSGFGEDQIDGGAGTDMLVVGFLSSTYRLEGSSAQGRLIDLGSNGFDRGTDTFTSIELVQFTDQTLGWNGTNWAAVAA